MANTTHHIILITITTTMLLQVESPTKAAQDSEQNRIIMDPGPHQLRNRPAGRRPSLKAIVEDDNKVEGRTVVK